MFENTPGADRARRAFVDAVRFLRDNTDTFDPVIVRITLDLGDDLKPTDEQIEELADAFVLRKNIPAYPVPLPCCGGMYAHRPSCQKAVR